MANVPKPNLHGIALPLSSKPSGCVQECSANLRQILTPACDKALSRPEFCRPGRVKRYSLHPEQRRLPSHRRRPVRSPDSWRHAPPSGRKRLWHAEAEVDGDRPRLPRWDGAAPTNPADTRPLPHARRPKPGAPPLPETAFWPSPAPIPSRKERRSEEHTSELQSRRDLVCRLL